MRQYFALAGVVLAIVPAILYYNSVTNARSEIVLTSIYVLKNDPETTGFLGEYPAGTVLSEDHLQILELTETSVADVPWAIRHEGQGLSEATRALLERPLTVSVPAGAVLQEAFFLDDPTRTFEMQIAAGHRAFSIGVRDDDSAGGFVEPGSIVDIYPRPEIDNDGRITVPADPIVSAVRVLAVGDHFSVETYRQAGRPSYSNVTVELLPEDISKLLLARENSGAQMSLSLYNPCAVETRRTLGCAQEN